MVGENGLLIALATFNERGNLPGLVAEIHDALPESQVLVVDDNSPDGTGQWCESQAATDPRFHVIHRAGKLGLGTATIAAMQFAIREDYTYLITMDADWSHRPRDLPRIAARLEDADIVIGSRYCQGGKIDDWPWSRRAISAAINCVSRVVLAIPARDCSGGFRGYRAELLADLDLSQIRATGFAYLEEILYYASRQGGRIAEVPITFGTRREGESKIGVHEAVGALVTVSRLALARLLGYPRRRKPDRD